MLSNENRLAMITISSGMNRMMFIQKFQTQKLTNLKKAVISCLKRHSLNLYTLKHIRLTLQISKLSKTLKISLYCSAQ